MRFRKFIKKYWIIILLLILCPIIINFIVLIPSFLPIVGNANLWISFFGSFAGSALMAGITLYVLQEQLTQNHTENERNRKDNQKQNDYNRILTLKIQKQEINLRWFDDLKSACTQLDLAFNNNDVTLLSDMDPLSECFNQKVSFLLSRMNEAFFVFHITVNYNKHISNHGEIHRLTNYVREYLSLLSDMNCLSIYGLKLKTLLEDIDYTPEEVNNQLKSFILTNKNKMEIPEITSNRVWDLLISDDFSSLQIISKVMHILRKRIDNFHMLKIGNSINSLLESEYDNIVSFQ
ncbi:MAG: hypothetical protein J1E16_05235 [Muribaculaceae bacterium]|nr:hypothetical protein [Muribaculaceae bacterium]